MDIITDDVNLVESCNFNYYYVFTKYAPKRYYIKILLVNSQELDIGLRTIKML